MAFVAPVAVRSHASPVLRSSPVAPLRQAPTSSSTAPRMGYGAYSYQTDKTKGHVNQYYVDKFRIAADFVKGAPASQADAKLGRNMKGGVLVPERGIPQPIDTSVLPIDPNATPDPRIAEHEGVVFPWDKNYVDPKFGADTYADCEDPDTVESAFASFRGSMVEERGSSLSFMNFGAAARVQRIKAGLDVDYLCSLDGQLDARYARLQKIDDPAVLSPTGVPQTEIPGTSLLRSVGAMDFIKKPGESFAFWKTDAPAELPYKKPAGNEAPEMPYNTSPSIGEMLEAQAARGLLPSQDE